MTLSSSTTADFTGFNPSSYAGGINFIRARYFIKLTCTHQGETRRGAVAANVANGIPTGTFNYQDARTRWGLSAQYSLTKRFALCGLRPTSTAASTPPPSATLPAPPPTRNPSATRNSAPRSPSV